MNGRPFRVFDRTALALWRGAAHPDHRNAGLPGIHALLRTCAAFTPAWQPDRLQGAVRLKWRGIVSQMRPLARPGRSRAMMGHGLPANAAGLRRR